MKLLTAMSIAFALALTSSMSMAQSADPIIGTWTLDATHSRFAGPAPRSVTRTYVAQGDAIAMTVKTTSAEGKETVQSATLKADGKDRPFEGAPGWDTVAIRSAGPHAVKFTLKKGGKVVGHGSRTVSADGKTLTLKTELVNSDGSQMADTQVYNRQ